MEKKVSRSQKLNSNKPLIQKEKQYVQHETQPEYPSKIGLPHDREGIYPYRTPCEDYLLNIRFV